MNHQPRGPGWSFTQRSGTRSNKRDRRDTRQVRKEPLLSERIRQIIREEFRRHAGSRISAGSQRRDMNRYAPIAGATAPMPEPSPFATVRIPKPHQTVLMTDGDVNQVRSVQFPQPDVEVPSAQVRESANSNDDMTERAPSDMAEPSETPPPPEEDPLPDFDEELPEAQPAAASPYDDSTGFGQLADSHPDVAAMVFGDSADIDMLEELSVIERLEPLAPKTADGKPPAVAQATGSETATVAAHLSETQARTVERDQQPCRRNRRCM